jgi:Bacterial TniB protein
MSEKLRSLPDVSHLHPVSQPVALLPDAERIAHIRADRWIGYTKAQKVLVKLEDLFTQPQRQRMPNLLLVGPTNNGKSMIIEKFRRAHPLELVEHSAHETIPLLTMQMPSDPSIARFYTMLLTALHAPLRPRARVAELEALALKILRVTKVNMLVIDELHNMLAGSGAMQREFLNLLRFLGNELRIPIVGVGTREAYLAIRSDDQLENRFEPFILPVWREGKEFMALLASFAVSFPLRRPSDLQNTELARSILTRTEGTIGEISTLLTHAAIAAVESGEEAVNAKTLKIAAYESPTERRRAFERELR